MALDPGIVTRIAERLGLKTWDSFVERACCDKKVIYLNGGWRGGKSASAAFILFLRIFLVWLRREGTHLVWLVGPDYEQARPEYFYLSQWAAIMGWQVEASAASQGSLRMTLHWPGKPGVVEVVTKSATDPTSLGSVAPVEILMCEAGQISEEGDMWIDGRTAEKNASVIKAGTFENDEGKAQFTWFEMESDRLWQNPGARQSAFRLPTWENMSLYSSCLNMLADDPSLSSWCPDQEHGESHSGLNHPMIRQLKERWKDRPRDWAKRFGGEPQGVKDPIYEWSLRDSLTDFDNNRYLKPLPEPMQGPNYRWLRGAGGMDFGVVHPSAACVGKQTVNGDTWVLDCPQDASGRLDWVWEMQKALSRIHHIPDNMWGRDPMVKYTPSYVPGEAMSGSLFARQARVGICNSIAGSGHLFFDANNPSVRVLFEQIQRLHWKRQPNGMLVYDRVDDDGPAAWEDMMAMLHGQPVFNLPRRWSLGKRHTSAITQPMRSVS